MMVRPVCPEQAKRYLEEYFHQLELRSEQRIRQRKKKRALSFSQADLQRRKLQLPPHSGVRLQDSAIRGCHSRRMSVDVGLMLGQAMIHNHSLQQSQVGRSAGDTGEHYLAHTCCDNNCSPLRPVSTGDSSGSLTADLTARPSACHTHGTVSLPPQKTVECAAATPKHKKKKWRMGLMKRFGSHEEPQGDTGKQPAIRKQQSSPSLACQQPPNKPSKCTPIRWRQLSSPVLQLMDRTPPQKQDLVPLKKHPQLLLAMGRLPAGTIVAESLHSTINGSKLGTQPLSKKLSWRKRDAPHPMQRSASFQHRSPRHHRPRFPSQSGPNSSHHYRESKVEDSAPNPSKCGAAWNPGTATSCEGPKELEAVHIRHQCHFTT